MNAKGSTAMRDIFSWLPQPVWQGRVGFNDGSIYLKWVLLH